MDEPDANLKGGLFRENIEELFERAPAGYLATMPDGRIVQVNQTLADWIGQSKQSLLSGVRFQDLLTLPGRIYYETHFAPLMQMQGFIQEVAFDLQRPGRGPLPVLVSANRNRDGALYLITVFDATDRRVYEQELLQARRKAQEAADAERLARAQAERANRVKDEFLAQISHELRNPLNAILGWTQILQLDDALNEDQREGLSIVERNTRVQIQLVDDLLDMGRILSGKMRLDVQRVNLAEVIAAAIDTARPAADAKFIRIQQILDPDVHVSADPGRLQQVFWNLLSNAIKFSPARASIRVVMQRINSHVEVHVVDSGQGMKPEFLQHAFERFRQSDTTGTRKTGGLGLGLNIVKKLVEMHGGSVQAFSEGEGKGSTFVVALPVVAVHDSEEPEQKVHPRAALADRRLDLSHISLAGLKILVTDDDHDARDLLRRILARCGAEVITAQSAREALAAVERLRPNLLISDIGMPETDGYELIRQIRMLGEGAGGIPAIALTAFARLEDRTRAMLAGYQIHLAKPVNPQELVVTVANLAGRISLPNRA